MARDASVWCVYIAGIRAILLHAISESATLFYLHCGFAESPLDPHDAAAADDRRCQGRAHPVRQV